jgi:hypothetical protein
MYVIDRWHMAMCGLREKGIHDRPLQYGSIEDTRYYAEEPIVGGR